MLVRHNKPGSNTPYSSDLVNTTGNMDYLKNGKIYKNAPTASVLVTAESDLEGLTAKYEPGTIAYTAGFVDMWQLSAAGEWVAIIEEGA